MKDENALIRRDATKALAMFGAAAEVAVPALIDALADENRWVRQDVVVALGKIGRAVEAAIPALTAIQDDERIGNFAKEALKEIAGP